jgi:hypothetical protein
VIIRGNNNASDGGTAVKIYLFNPETGIYLGEDFADEEPMQRGVFRIPRDGTSIAPPQVGPGQELRFDTRMQRWDVREHPATARESFYDRLGGDDTTGDLYESI